MVGSKTSRDSSHVLTDLHMHSTFSDGEMTIPELVDLYGKRGFGAIAITDHLCEKKTAIGKAARYLNRTLTPATFPIYREILKSEAERARREYGMLVVPGFELTKNTILNSRSAHVLALGVSEWIDADAPVEEICAAIHAQGGLAVAAHPVSTRKLEKQTHFLWDRREELAAHFDAWEVASGRVLFEEVLASGLPMIANSDLHRRKQLDSWKTVVARPLGGARGLEIEDLFHAVRSRSVSFEYYVDQASRPVEEGLENGNFRRDERSGLVRRYGTARGRDRVFG